MYDPIAAIEERERISPTNQFRWLRHVSRLVQRRYNGASKPLNIKIGIGGISYSTVYAVNTARLSAAQLPFSEEVPNRFVAKYVPLNLSGEREAALSTEFSDSVGLRVYSTTSLERTVELAFEQADGSLSDILEIDEVSEDSTRDFASIAYLIVKSLYALEEKGFVHGDIKPGNIFLVRRDQRTDLRLGDFEWTFLHADYLKFMKEYTSLFGTPGFYPPEFFTPERYSLKNPTAHDMFSYGVTLYTLLFGSFPGEMIFDINNIAKAHAFHSLYLVRGLYYQEMQTVLSDADIIPDLKEVILRTTHPRPQKRYQSFSDVLQKLEKYVV